MFIEVNRSGRRGLESVEGHVSMGIRDVIQASKSDLMAKGVAFDLLQMAKRVVPQCEAIEYEYLSEEEDFPLDNIVKDDRRSHRPDGDRTEELSMKAPISVSKPADLG